MTEDTNDVNNIKAPAQMATQPDLLTDPIRDTEHITKENLNLKVAEWRAKAAAGTLSLEDMRAGLDYLRAGRRSAAATSSKARGTAKKIQAASAADLLDQLSALGD